ncbi:interleukin-17d [Limosa lapponica baueri]|uniref:Interleukin-17d n=1 Tax=Limosa lapponica baueri TaxID=1758121 RepID=A0A2I0TTW6_LIMLA|nr:interleukin-17d [Limosa lapponica baueri]
MTQGCRGHLGASGNLRFSGSPPLFPAASVVSTPARCIFHHLQERVSGNLEISYDPTRYPKYIPEAYCLCKGCLMGIFGEENFHFRSTPVYMPTVILRRTSSCAGGRYVYTEDYVTIPVGCTCVPEQEKEAESVNSSIDKQEMKLLVSQNKPSSE